MFHFFMEGTRSFAYEIRIPSGTYECHQCGHLPFGWWFDLTSLQASLLTVAKVAGAKWRASPILHHR